MKRDKTNTMASAEIIHDSMEGGAAMATVSTPTTRSTIVVASAEEREGAAMGADGPILFTSLHRASSTGCLFLLPCGCNITPVPATLAGNNEPAILTISQNDNKGNTITWMRNIPT